MGRECVYSSAENKICKIHVLFIGNAILPMQCKIKNAKFFSLAASSGFPEMKSEDGRHVSRDRAGEMGSPLGTARCLIFNHQAQYLDLVFRKQGGVMK